MKIEARFADKAPEQISDVERLTITHGECVLEIALTGAGLHLRLDEPLGKALAVFPHATNTVVLRATREDEIK